MDEIKAKIGAIQEDISILKNEVNFVKEMTKEMVNRKRITKADPNTVKKIRGEMDECLNFGHVFVSVREIYEVTGIKKNHKNGLIIAKMMREKGFVSKVKNVDGLSVRGWAKREDIHI